jgi:hypothetical protein
MSDATEGDKLARQRVGEWSDWHEAYQDESSEIVGRMMACRRHVAAVVDEAPEGPITVVSICGGQGRELIGALEDHPRKGDVRGRLVELDPGNTEFAARWAAAAGLTDLEVVTGDASVASSYTGLPAADLVVISGVFGHIHEDDRLALIDFVRQICHTGSNVVWTSHLSNGGPAEWLRRAFLDRRFEELEYDIVPGDDFRFTVTRNVYTGEQQPFHRDARIFTFGSSRTQRGETSAP